MLLKFKNYSIILLLIVSFTSCNKDITSVDKRKQKLERKKKLHPNDCPKLDC